MTNSTLKFISDKLDSLNIHYQFGEFIANPLPDPYFSGEFIENESETLEESGFMETAFILTGIGTNWLTLLSEKEKIRKNIDFTGIVDGNGLSISYSNAQNLPVEDGELKRVQINLKIKEWMVN